MARAQEERKALLAAANAKKQKGGKSKKSKDEPVKEEEEIKQEEKKVADEPKRDLDLTDPEEFAMAVKEKFTRPFTFGPIEFSELNVSQEDKPFDAEAAREQIITGLEKSMGDQLVCIHGYLVKIKGRNFKRRSTMLKHGRFL